MNQVAALYDALHDFESRYRRGIAYPVHKRLQFPDPSMTDIYDWIIAEVGLPETGAILDAGCGTGFGSLRLAEASDCDVTGISLSEKEIAAARRAAEGAGARERVTFDVLDIGQVPAHTFDLAIAVESLKHSADLAQTLDRLCAALRDGGRLVVVDDFFTGAETSPDAKRLIENWGLTGLYREADVRASPRAKTATVIDLTAFVRMPGLRTRLARRAVRLLRPWFGRAMSPEVRKAFAGGVCLERLYAAGNMQYKALIIPATSGEIAE